MKNLLSYVEKKKAEAILINFCSRAEDGYAKYHDGWDDKRMAEFIASSAGFPCTEVNIASLRKEVIGTLIARSSKGGGLADGMVLARLTALEARVAFLEGELGVTRDA